MALETTKTTYLNGSSKDGGRVLANFSSSLSESGTMTINETISDNANLDTLDTVEADFNEFRELAKNELKKLNSQDTETNVPSYKTADKAATPTSDNEAVKGSEPVETTTKADDKSETDVSSNKTGDKEVVAPTSNNEVVKDDKPADTVAKTDDKPEAGTPDEVKVSDVKDGEETKQPVANEEVKQSASSEEPNQPVASDETNQPVASEETKEATK